MKQAIYIIRVLTGLVFIFSGLVKGIDPLGSAYKFHDYFQAFNLEFLQFLTLPLSIGLSTLELITGFSLFSGTRQKAGIWSAALLIILFTPLTLVLAISNPVSDCGCFGDAIHLTNWQTFFKNLVLFLMIALLFFTRKNIKVANPPFKEWFLIGFVSVLMIVFCLSNLKYLPVVDFLPYKPGVNIPEKMNIPEDAPGNVYETTFIYEKYGSQKEFTLDDYPADDTSWVFVDQKSVLIKKGYEPPIHDFSLTTTDNEDLTDRVLRDQGYSLLMISQKLDKADVKDIETGFQKGIHCLTNDIAFYVLTASGSEEIKSYENGLQFCMTDEITLKTMVRSNPGYVLIRDGTIIGKWSKSNVPDDDWFSGNIYGKQIEQIFTGRSELRLLVILLLGSLLIAFIYLITIGKIKFN
jgi:hypothetical protein